MGVSGAGWHQGLLLDPHVSHWLSSRREESSFRASAMDAAAEHRACRLQQCLPKEGPPLSCWTLHGFCLSVTVLLTYTLPCSPSAQSS